MRWGTALLWYRYINTLKAKKKPTKNIKNHSSYQQPVMLITCNRQMELGDKGICTVIFKRHSESLLSSNTPKGLCPGTAPALPQHC